METLVKICLPFVPQTILNRLQPNMPEFYDKAIQYLYFQPIDQQIQQIRQYYDKQFNKYGKAYYTQYTCDECRTDIPDSQWYICPYRECDYDVCKNCIQQEEFANDMGCPVGHPLRFVNYEGHHVEYRTSGFERPKVLNIKPVENRKIPVPLATELSYSRSKLWAMMMHKAAQHIESIDIGFTKVFDQIAAWTLISDLDDLCDTESYRIKTGLIINTDPYSSAYEQILLLIHYESWSYLTLVEKAFLNFQEYQVAKIEWENDDHPECSKNFVHHLFWKSSIKNTVMDSHMLEDSRKSFDTDLDVQYFALDCMDSDDDTSDDDTSDRENVISDSEQE